MDLRKRQFRVEEKKKHDKRTILFCKKQHLDQYIKFQGHNVPGNWRLARFNERLQAERRLTIASKSCCSLVHSQEDGLR